MNEKFIAFALACFISVGLRAANISLAWDPSPSPSVAGYHVWYGARSGAYTVPLDAGAQTAFTLTTLSPGRTYYLSVTAYDQYGADSPCANQVIYTVSALPTLAPQLATVTYAASGATLTPGASITVSPGANVTFAAILDGGAPALCQWRLGTAAVSGANAPTLNLLNVGLADAGQYSLVVSSDSGSVATTPMTLAVVPLQTGSFNGLFYQTNGDGSANIAVESSGALANWVVGASGVYSGKIYIHNARYTLSGTIDFYGNGESIVSRAATSEGSLDFKFNLNSTLAAGQLTGTVSNMDATAPWCASLLADSAGPGNPLAPKSYAVLTAPAASFLPAGSAIIGNLLSQMALTSLLPDGTLFIENTPISTVGRLPVYTGLYGGFGLVEGWINLSDSGPSGSLAWLQHAGAPNSNYPNGFTNMLQVAPRLP